MSTSRHEPHREIQERLARVRARWVLQARLKQAGPWMACAAAALAFGALVVRLGQIRGLALLLLMAASVILAVASLCAAVVRARQVPADHQVARFIEERVSALTGDESWKDGIVSAVEIAQSGGTREGAFHALILGECARRLRGIDPRHLVTAHSMRAGAWSTAAGGVCLMLASAASAPSLRRAVDVARVTLFPGTIGLDVSPGSVRLPAGSALRVHTQVRGGDGRDAPIAPVITVTAADGTSTVPMVVAGDGFEWALPAVERTFAYRVSAGATRSSEYTVTALFHPRVTRIDVSYTYPAFAGLGPREERDGGDIYAPAGTRVRLRIHTDRPVVRGEVTLAGTPAVAARPAGQGVASGDVLDADLIVTNDDSYRVTLTDAEGLQSRTAAEYFIRRMDDRPPHVRISRPSADQQISPLEEIAIEARADDDYGIAAFDLVYAVSGGRERTLPFTHVSGTLVARVGSALLSAEELGLRPGDAISYYARARDIGRGKRPTRATSDIYFLEVKPFSEEFAGSASQATGQAGAASIDSLVDAQKQIIASTWNIERRSPAGRSPGALKAVAEAQALLRTRAEQMASRSSRRPGRMQVPQSGGGLQPGGAWDPLGAAAQAMGRAVEQLETHQTKEALPHEMAALNGLLQAQAEVRRREIARQQANGAGSGGNRTGQDLSALFDKELQRQQQTNYETPRTAEAPASGTAPDAALLDRIRDLARRQEDLSRRQGEATGKMDEDQARRRLEKLTREQTQLRDEAEDLARRLRAERPGGRPRASGSELGDGESLEAAARQMRAAASQLRRDDAMGAARSGARAADQLRRAEESARGRSAGAPERAAAAERKPSQLPQQLERADAIRERLNRLDAQMRGSRARGSSGQGSGSGEQKQAPVPEEYWRELAETRKMLEQIARAQPAGGAGGRVAPKLQSSARSEAGASFRSERGSPEQEQFSRAAPGTEAFKQDRTAWESLRADVGLALEQYEAALSSGLARKTPADERLSAGGSEQPPDGYRELIARYFESLASVKKAKK